MMRLFRLPQSLVFRIVGASLLLIFAVGLVRIFILSNVLEVAINHYVSEQQLALTSYAAQEIDEELLARKSLLLKLADEFPTSLIQNPKALQDWFAKQHIQSPMFRLGLVYVTADGHGVQTDSLPLGGRRQLDFSGRDWFLAARDKGDFAIGKPVLDDVADEAAVHMAVPIKNASGEFLGVLMGATSLNQHAFLEPINKGNYGKPNNFLLISPKDKIIVLDSAREIALKPAPLPGVEPLYDRAATGWRGSGITATRFGFQRWETYVSVPTANWVLVGRVSSTQIFAGFQHALVIFLWLNVLGLILTASFVGWLLWWLLRPLKSMTNRMHLMAEGKIPLGKLSIVHKDEVGRVMQSFNLLVDQLLITQERLTHLAQHDPLTQLPNRRLFLEDLAHSCALALRQSNPLALLFIDLDRFKCINDSYGHGVGDQMLKQVADRLNEGVRKSDRVARLGGDEFVVVLMDCKGRENLAAVARKWVVKLSEPYVVEGIEMHIGVSIGIGVFPDHASDIETLIALTDAAMYGAKRRGTGTYWFVGD